jgi:hypothetical protein
MDSTDKGIKPSVYRELIADSPRFKLTLDESGHRLVVSVHTEHPCFELFVGLYCHARQHIQRIGYTGR